MPTLRRLCSYPACDSAAEPGRKYCAPHRALIDARKEKEKPAEKRASSTARGYGARWRKVRKAFLSANPVCVKCGRPAEEVDHITPKRDGGGDEPENLQALCKSCHSKKTIEENRGKGGRIAPKE